MKIYPYFCSRKTGFMDFIIMKKLSVSLISYLNSRPFLYGLEHSPVKDEIRIFLDIPAKTAAKLAAGQVDIGLIPVGALSDLKDYHIVSNFCIGADGQVRTTVLASEVPLEEIETVILDYQSRSSVLLTRVMSHFYWKKTFKWENSCANFEKKLISGKTAGVVIGDRVFAIEKKYPYIYDLAEEWKNFTGLPFVYAVWVAAAPIPADFLGKFNEALVYGIRNFQEVEKSEMSRYPEVDIFDYFTRNISYDFDERKKEGMRKFLEMADQLKFSVSSPLVKGEIKGD
jgi:chorismate dehydratase